MLFSIYNLSLSDIIYLMIIWQTNFQIFKPLEAFSRPIHLEYERQNSPQYNCEGHARYGLVVFTIRGEGCFQYDQERYRLLPGTAYVCCGPDRMIHYFYPEEMDEPWEFIWFSFAGEAALKMLAEMINEYGYVYRFEQSAGYYLELLKYGNLKNNLAQLNAVEGSRLVQGVLHGLLDKMVSTRTEQEFSISTKAQQLIIRNLENPQLSVDFLARKFHLSRAHFSRIFYRDSGMHPDDFIRRHRLLLACSLLKNSSMSCKEIADRLCFANSGNFSRSFQANLGMSPLKFRRYGSFFVI